MSMELSIGVDTGGTFTDVVAADLGGEVVTAIKVPTDVESPARGIEKGVAAILETLGADPSSIRRFVHGTTYATNLVHERKGARVAYVSTEGFEDVPLIGRETRSASTVFSLEYEKPYPMLATGSTFGISGRIGARGEVVSALDEKQASRVARQIVEGGFDAAAICLLNSYANPGQEQQLLRLFQEVAPELFTLISSEISPGYREYDRAMTTVISSYIGPGLSQYLHELRTRLENLGVPARVEMMLSHGGVATIDAVLRQPGLVLESGPAAGLLQAATVGRMAAVTNTITFDMGGTTAKAGVAVGGVPRITRDFFVSAGDVSSGGRYDADGLPMRIPVVDVAEVGAGGGSIASVDQWGVLKVGPESAAATPGPACYGHGGTLPTVTDANLVLGFLGAERALDGGITLSREAAVEAIRVNVADPLGIDVVEAAQGIVRIANARMGTAIRLVTLSRGLDPREFVLVGFGGAGPSHAIAMAGEFGIDRVLVPTFAGVLSAVGLVAAEFVHELATTFINGLDEQTFAKARAELETMSAAAREVLQQQLTDDESIAVALVVALRFRHQAHDLDVEIDPATWETLDHRQLESAFHEKYAKRFGVTSVDPVEIVTLRVRATGGRASSPDTGSSSMAADQVSSGARRLVHYAGYETGDDGVMLVSTTDSILDRGLPGPVIVEDRHSSFAVPAGWTVTRNSNGFMDARRSDPPARRSKGGRS